MGRCLGVDENVTEEQYVVPFNVRSIIPSPSRSSITFIGQSKKHYLSAQFSGNSSPDITSSSNLLKNSSIENHVH